MKYLWVEDGGEGLKFWLLKSWFHGLEMDIEM